MYLCSSFVHRWNIGAFCLSMRENRSVRLQMADLSGVVSFVMVFMKNMDWIFVRSLRIRVNSTQVRVLVLLQFPFRQNSWFFSRCETESKGIFCPKYIKLTLSNFHLQISSTVTSIEWDGQISDIYPYTLLCHHRSIYTAYELAVRAWQLDSVTQLVRALHQNHRAASSIPGWGRIRYVYSTLNVGTQTIYSVLGPPVNIGAFCLRMCENRSVRLQMADLPGFWVLSWFLWKIWTEFLFDPPEFVLILRR
jgi:hypothetical protein